MRGKKGSEDPELSPDQFKQLAQWLNLGLTITDACTLMGITTQTFYKWQAVGKERPPGHPLRQFADAVARGKTSAKAYALGQVSLGMKRDWKAAAWYLSVSHPQEYGPKVKVTLEKEFGDAVANLEEDFAEQPEVLGKILSSLTRRRGPSSDGPPGAAAAEPDPGPDTPAPGLHSEPE